jgi:hypothetical protein
MPALYWYTTCPFCDHQGRLFIYKNLEADQLYLHCEECERGYTDPTSISPETSFLTLLTDFKVEAPSLAEILEGGWGSYARHIFNVL